MTDKRKPDRWARASGDTPSTLRSIEVAEVVSPDEGSFSFEDHGFEDHGFEDHGFERPVYYEPQPLVAVSDHKTLEIDTIKLAQDIDPRRLPTELRLRPVPMVPPDSDWPPPDVVIVSSQPPSAGRGRWRAPAALLLLLGSLIMLALVLARAAAQRWHAPTPAGVSLPTAAKALVAAAARPSATAAVALPTAAVAASAEAPATPVAADPPPSATLPDVVLVSPEKPPRGAHGAVKSNPRHSSPTPNASSPALAAPSVSKPKRAIY